MRLAAILIAASAVHGRSVQPPGTQLSGNTADNIVGGTTGYVIATVDSLEVANGGVSASAKNPHTKTNPELSVANGDVGVLVSAGDAISIDSVEVSNGDVSVSVDSEGTESVSAETNGRAEPPSAPPPLPELSVDSVEISNGDVSVSVDGKDIESLSVENVDSVSVDVSETNAARDSSTVDAPSELAPPLLPELSVDSVDISNGDLSVSVDGKDIVSLFVENVDSVSVEIADGDKPPTEATDTGAQDDAEHELSKSEPLVEWNWDWLFNENMRNIMSVPETEADRVKVGLRLLEAAKIMLDPRTWA